MSHVFKLEQFEGPLDLLLRMIEEEKMNDASGAIQGDGTIHPIFDRP